MAKRKRAKLIELVRTSGSPIKVVAEQMGVSVSTAYLVVGVGGAVIQLEHGFDAELLRQVVAARSRVPA